MAIKLLRTWGGQQYEWGYLLRIDLADGERIINDTAQWPKEPTKEQIETAVAGAIARAEKVRDEAPATTDPRDDRIVELEAENAALKEEVARLSSKTDDGAR
jgi:hypothetical protein